MSIHTYSLRPGPAVALVTLAMALSGCGDDLASLNSTPVAALAEPEEAKVVGEEVQIDAGDSADPDGDELVYVWTLEGPKESRAKLKGQGTAQASFEPDVPGTYTLELIVDDGKGGTAAATVVIAIGEPPLMCEEPHTECGSSCVDVSTDGKNCGECGNECGFGGGCNGGGCICLSGGTWCGEGECVDLRSDKEHCGECGNTCGDGTYCEGGECHGGADTKEIAEVLFWTNEFRRDGVTCCECADGSKSCPSCVPIRMPPVGEVAIHGLLNQAAQNHAQDMHDRRFFAHVNPDGEGPGHRARAVGFRGGVGENIAAGHRDAEAAVRAWIDSKSGHCTNLMNSRYRVMGVGYAPQGPQWVQKFSGSTQ